jgi:aminopeptidase N
VSGAPGIGDPYYPDLGNGGYDVQKYTLKLSIDPEEGGVNGSAAIEAKAAENLASFDLDFSGLSIDSITVDGSPAQYSRSDPELKITPSTPLQAGGDFSVVIAYHGEPAAIAPVSEADFASESGFKVGWTRAVNGAINVISEPNGASSWFPSNNHPRDKASYRFEVTVPDPWIVAANGSLVETRAGEGATTFVWVMQEPMASYLASINVDKYTVKKLAGPHGILIRNYFPPGYPESDAERFDRLPEMIEFLESVYGPYPFKEYGVAVADLDNPLCQQATTALEAQTLSVHCPASSMASDEAIVHELAHQWFGDSVSLENWKDIWLKEGMATYAQWLWLERGQELADLTLVARANMPHSDLDSPIAEPPPQSLYRFESYGGGALVFHALRLKVGEEDFFKILKTYLERFKNANAGTDEFIAVAEEVSGQDLRAFFDTWLYSTHLPGFP